MNQPSLSRCIALLGLLFAIFCCSLAPIQAADDQTPPYLVDPIPNPNSSGNAQNCTVKVAVVDDLSGVEQSTIEMQINGAPPIVEPIIEPLTSGRGYNIYTQLEGFAGGETITITITAEDYNQNVMHEFWRFQIAQMIFDERVVALYPLDNAWLDYDLEQHHVRFSWTEGYVPGCYRLKLTPDSLPSGTIDIEQNSDGNPFGMIIVDFPISAAEDWMVLKSLGSIQWQVAPIERIGGAVMGGYTPVQSLRYCTQNIPLLLTPSHNAIIRPGYPPYVSWKAISDADGYYFICARLDEQGRFTNDVISSFIPPLITELAISPSTWETYSPGNWTWSVVATFPDGRFSEYMLNRFTKLESNTE